MQRFSILLSTILLFIIGCKTSENTEASSDLISFTDALFKESIDSNMIAGGSILIHKDGEVLVDKAYGYASLELDVPTPENATYEIGSVTKQFTAAAILKLVEEGKLDLENDFTEYLDFDTGGRTITISNLLDHTSGINSYTEMPNFWELSIENHPRDTLVRMVEAENFLFEPGEAMIYNNSAYFFLGLIIEKVSEMTYEEYLDEKIFQPLGMNETYYCSNSKVRKNKVYGYNYNPEGLRQKPYLDHLWPYAAGSLCSTTEDLLTWLTALHGGKVFDEAMYQSIITPNPLKDGSAIRYAKGLTNFNDNGHQCISHGGGIHGFLSETRYYPEEDLTVICLVNTTGPHGGGYFADEVTWHLLDKKSKETASIDVDLESLTGTYSGQARGRVLTLDVGAIESGLTVQVQGRENIDTVTSYIGDGRWMDDNQIMTLDGDKLTLDAISGFYVLTKQ